MDAPSLTPPSPFLLRPTARADLRGAIEAALADRGVIEAWVAGHGTLAEAELRDGDATKAFATSCRIVALTGSVEVREGAPRLALTATLGRASMRGLELIAGEIVRARVESTVLLVTPLTSRTGNSRADDDGRTDEHDDAPKAPASPWDILAEASERSVDEPPARASNARGAPAPVKAPLNPVRAAATALPTPAAPVALRKKVALDDQFPDVGDAVDHFAFGRVRVLKSDGEELLVRDEATGKTRTIRLSVLEVAEPTDEGGVRLFKLSQRRGPPTLR